MVGKVLRVEVPAFGLGDILAFDEGDFELGGNWRGS